MNMARLTTALHFTQPLRLHAILPPQGITLPFPETPRRPVVHDMLLLNAHHDLNPEPAPQLELTFFNLDFP
jgi:hypothetical protein